AEGQTAHKPSQKAKKLMVEAMVRYTHCGGNRDSMQAINKMVDAAIKADSLYFEAWSNKVALVCQLGEFDNAIRILQHMQRIFPGNFEAMFNCGVLQDKTGHDEEARATFTRLLKQLDNDLAKYKGKPEYKAVAINKGIVLILL